MGTFIDLTGQQFGQLIVVERAPNKGKHTCWLCQCDCGNTTIVYTTNLRRGYTKSCGCTANKKSTDFLIQYNQTQHKIQTEDLIGKQYNWLTILDELPENENNSKSRKMICRCKCGKIKAVNLYDLKSGVTKSCGCINMKDITGQVFGKLTALKMLNERNNNGDIMWLCQCECGNTIKASGHYLRNGSTQSCGCLISKGEYQINLLLTNNNIKFETQKTFETCCFPKTNALLRFDFYVNNQYLIEFDGKQHYDLQCFNGIEKETAQNNFQKIQERDQFKNQWCKENHIPLIRIPYTQLPKLELKDLLLTEENPFICIK